VIADASGRAIGFALAPGQAHELPLAPLLLTVLSLIPAWIVADRGYASHAFRDLIWQLGARPAIPAKRTEERWLGKFGQADKWRICLTAAKVPQIRSKNDETSTTDAQPRLQGEGGAGGDQG
jgi:transposase